MTTTLYDVLGIAATASATEVRRAYRSLARQVHPDQVGAPPDAVRRMAEVNAAWAVLGDPQRRSLYDRSLQLGADGGPLAGHRGGSDDPFGAGPFGARPFGVDGEASAQAVPRSAPVAVHPPRRLAALVRVGTIACVAFGVVWMAIGFATGAAAFLVFGFMLVALGGAATFVLVLFAMKPPGGRPRLRRPRSDNSLRRRRVR